MNWNFYGLFGLVVVFGFLFIVMYNRLVRLRVRTEDGWSGIDVQLKRRYDLIPNLVETVKGYAKHTKNLAPGAGEEKAQAKAKDEGRFLH